MNQNVLEAEIKHMIETQFFPEDQMAFITTILIPDTIEKIRDEFGYNDGEPLDQDGIDFIVEIFKLNLYLTHTIFEES